MYTVKIFIKNSWEEKYSWRSCKKVVLISNKLNWKNCKSKNIKMKQHKYVRNERTTNETKNKFQSFPDYNNKKAKKRTHHKKKTVYKYKLRIKQLLLKQVSNAMISYSSFWRFLFSSSWYIYFIGTFFSVIYSHFFYWRVKWCLKRSHRQNQLWNGVRERENNNAISNILKTFTQNPKTDALQRMIHLIIICTAACCIHINQ